MPVFAGWSADMMSTSDSFSHAKQQLLELPPSVTLVILHPDFHGQHRLFAPLLSEAAITPVFLAVSEPGLTLQDLLVELKEAVEVQLDPSVADLPTDPIRAASALAKSLNKTPDTTLILDAYDRLDQEEVTPFIVALTRQLTNGCRLVLSTRVLPMPLIEHEDLAGKTGLVPVNPDKMILDYTNSLGKDVLEVRALGPGRVLINGRLVEHWDGVLPRMLFFYFVDRGMTTRDEIFHTFWPNLSTREATNVFHVTKRKISEILGTDLTVYWSGFYRISPDLELHYDVVKFAEAVQNAAVAQDDEAIALLQNAITLYNGPFLSMMDQPWVSQRREELASSYAEALAGLARIYKIHNAPLDALGYFLRAAATSPQREDLARSIMELYYNLGRPADALDTYQRLESELKSSLGVTPGPQTVELAKQIRTAL
jgi:DNA-binding SARP family transcriptional activator